MSTKQATTDETTKCVSKLRSYRVMGHDGGQVMSIILPHFYTLKEINDLLQNGMRVTAIDERSMLVKGVNYDCI